MAVGSTTLHSEVGPEERDALDELAIVLKSEYGLTSQQLSILQKRADFNGGCAQQQIYGRIRDTFELPDLMVDSNE